MLLKTEYVLKHIDALLRLSHDVTDRAVSAKLKEMADEFRITVAVADISDFAATLNKNAVPLAPDLCGAGAVSNRTFGYQENRLGPGDPTGGRLRETLGLLRSLRRRSEEGLGRQAVDPRPQRFETSGGPGRTRTSNQTVMSGRL
jgi:hypothetical protein